jgi:ribosomal protein S18 acetylase RimI-like enzyme
MPIAGISKTTYVPATSCCLDCGHDLQRTAGKENRPVNMRAGCSVRLAQPGDAAQVAALLAELGYPDNPVEEVRRRLAMWERETAGLALVADRQGQVVGIIAVAAIPYLEREGRRGRIVALVVSSACRGRGIGRRLVDAAEEAASNLDCVTMEVTSSRSRTESHPFYRNLGYEDGGDRSARYIKDLVPGTSAVSHSTLFPRHHDPTAPA